MDLNSPFFDRIRIKPAADEPRRRAEPGCDHPGCRGLGLHRAPKGRGNEGQYWRYCLEHVREYNKTYNYFAGMPDDAVMAYQKDATIGHRPTWDMGVNGSRRRKDGAPSPTEFDYLDPLGILRSGRPSHARRAPEPERTRRPGLVIKALETLGLEENADAPTIKAQYKALVKRFHPDAHGGDRSFEDRLRDIIRAHDTLKAAGLC
ncbi:DnaJ domain-containing protein [Enterovirga sp.]|uniref:J domain-containing protein n=1 Tax=Enterovirga sp. TaxID=2026350 RepID=UPI00261244FE|nr:DnaJ domain-containing protein [Enterovirga sp.]MDB5591961.1 molecular chaperone DnaJ [Enterovirga sp.]